MASRALIDPETGIVTRGDVRGQTVEQVCDAYLSRCETDERMPTLTEWALELGYSSAQALGDFERRHCATPCAPALKRARARIEVVWVQHLASGRNNPAGYIFGLKNQFNWRDKSDDELRHSVVLTLTEEMREVIERLAEAMIGRIGNP